MLEFVPHIASDRAETLGGFADCALRRTQDTRRGGASVTRRIDGICHRAP